MLSQRGSTVPIRCRPCCARVWVVQMYCTTGSYRRRSAAGRQKTSRSSQVHRGVHLLLNYFTGRGLLPLKADPALKGYCNGTIILSGGRRHVQRNQSRGSRAARDHNDKRYLSEVGLMRSFPSCRNLRLPKHCPKKSVV